MKISDYIMKTISDQGVSHVFYVSGGGAMHLNDSLGRNEKLEPVAMLHEQGASIAAEGYARISEGFGACLVTSGPGATNALTGLAGAYIDSTPVIYISGQVKRADLVADQNIRQFGIQEVDIISMAKSCAKYAVQIQNPEDIRYEMEKCISLATTGRPGPVWIDVPLDIQAMDVDIDSLKGYDKKEEKPVCTKEQLDEIISLFNQSKRPLMIVGNGIRLAGGTKEIEDLINYLNIPVLTSWNGVDLIEEAHPMYYGRPGSVGQRHANFIQQSADFVLTIGTRLNLLATGYNYHSFLENAKHIMVDIDKYEMRKKNVHPYMAVESDAKEFIKALLKRKEELDVHTRDKWIEKCNYLKEKYPVIIKEQKAGEGYVSTYDLVREISSQMTENDIYQFTSSGTSVDIAMKVLTIKKGQRAFLTKGLAAMGFDLPACIGSCMASGNRRTICVTGDGSIAMNMQELEVLKRYNLPVKIFVVDNSGYSMIYGSQNGNFKGRLTGCTKESGLTLPDMAKVAAAFGIASEHIDDSSELKEKVEKVLSTQGPCLCTVKADITQKILPRQANYMKEDGQMASRPLDDMMPLLDREELEKIKKL